MRNYPLLLLVLAFCISCKDDEPAGELSLYGSGEFNFSTYAPFAEKPLRCFYYIPGSSTANTPVLIAIHGAGRDGRALRNALVASADERGFIVLSAQFANEYFPGVNAFNLANIFANGEQPSSATLNPEETWTFSVLDPLFEHFKSLSGSRASNYDLFGHSAGAQLVHRFLLCAPESRVNRLVASAAGWYMVPDAGIQFPYGLALSPAAQVDPALYFSRRVHIIVGELDTDPNSFNLRHTPQADAQGLNRVERAQHFHQRSQAIADSLSLEYQWLYSEVPQVGHDVEPMAIFAASLLYN